MHNLVFWVLVLVLVPAHALLSLIGQGRYLCYFHDLMPSTDAIPCVLQDHTTRNLLMWRRA